MYDRHRYVVLGRNGGQRLKLDTDAAGIGIWMWEPVQDRVNWKNEWLHALLGLDDSEMPINASGFAAEFVHPGDRARLVETVTSPEKPAPASFSRIGSGTWRGRSPVDVPANEGTVRRKWTFLFWECISN